MNKLSITQMALYINTLKALGEVIFIYKEHLYEIEQGADTGHIFNKYYRSASNNWLLTDGGTCDSYNPQTVIEFALAE